MKLFRSIRVQSLLKSIDLERLHEIQRRHEASTARYAKYAEVMRWLKINLRRAVELELDRLPRKEILDLGCGAGFFLFIAKQLGHSGIGVDVADHDVPNELIDLFGVNRRVWRITALQPLPDFGKRFDLITGFSAAFNRTADESRGWNIDEWNFFLDDLQEQQLKPGGTILLEVNSGKTGKYFTPAVRDLFLRRGAKVISERVIFQGVDGLTA